jgi:hypothetical protein
VSDPYGSAHEAIRKAMLATSGPATPCARCGKPLGPDPSQVDLGHRDDGPGYNGLECAKCNRAAGGRKGAERRQERRQERARVAGLVAEVALAVEISHTRDHCSIASAGYLDGDLILVGLARYLDYRGDAAGLVAAVGELREDRDVLAVVVDPHAPAATAIAPLEAARIAVTRPTSSDLAIAHGGWLDLLRAGRVRHQRQPTLDAAMAALEQRRLGGATGPERRGAASDVSPAVACEWAAWALETLPRPVQPIALVGK